MQYDEIEFQGKCKPFPYRILISEEGGTFQTGLVPLRSVGIGFQSGWISFCFWNKMESLLIQRSAMGKFELRAQE
jgi:hypothetical protein